MASIFQTSTNSRRKTIEMEATIIGEENMIADVMVNGRYFIAIKLKNVQTTSNMARKDKRKNVFWPIFRVTEKGPAAPIREQPNCTA
jgi:phosphatidate phosphatase PAH1